jgi:DNA-3-methyladenine glycosylase I
MLPDALPRCSWPGLTDPLYTQYHDTEWGVPVADDQRLFEKLCLESFQAGLSWLTILKKRQTFRQAFDGFDAQRVVRYTDTDVQRLLADPGIIRNRAKIDATIANAGAYLKLQERVGLATFLWNFVDGRPVTNTFRAHGDVPATTALSDRVSKALKQEGFRFVGSTTVYAFLQSMGFVNDHLVSCHRHATCAALQTAFVVSATAESKPSKRVRGSGRFS